MSGWLQTRRVRHLVIATSALGALCGATPRMWFNDPPGTGVFVFDNPRTTTPADLTLPVCSRCQHALDQLNEADR